MIIEVHESVAGFDLTTRRRRCCDRNIYSQQEAAALIEDLMETLESQQRDPQDIFAVRLIVEEALANALVHGNRNDSQKPVAVRCDVFADRILIEIEDQGCGFDWHKVPDPRALENIERSSGRGLLLMRVYSTWMLFNENGNRLTLCRALSGGGMSNEPQFSHASDF